MDTNVTPNKNYELCKVFIILLFYIYRDIRDIKNIIIEIFKHTEKKKKSYHATNLVEITLIFKPIYKLFLIKLR